MNKKQLSAWFRHGAFFTLLAFVGWSGAVLAAVATVDSKVIADSPESFSQRIYSYDMGVDSNDDVHIVYSRPAAGGVDQIVYVRRVGGQWQPELVLSADGLRSSISTHLEMGGDNSVHICYIRSSTQHLYYRKIINGVAQTERFVDQGAWHSVMQLDGAGNPVFVRENETWPALVSQLVRVSTTNGNTWTKSYLALPQVSRFRLADFLYQSGRYHLTYGDSAYTKPVLLGKGSTTYTNGTFHNLWYASSDNGGSWSPVPVDQSGTLYENEFWTALTVDANKPLVGMYRYAEYGGQYNTGTSALLALWTGTAWEKRYTNTEATYPDTREGAGLGLVVTDPGYYLGVWDFSPDDTHNAYFRGAHGNTALAWADGRSDRIETIQVDSFSAEGRVVLRRRGKNVHILVLGDFVDTKLYYRELNLDAVDAEFQRIYSGFPWTIFLPAIVSGAVHR